MPDKILLVDDEQHILDGYRRALHGRFYLETAISGREALATLNDSGPFAVVVSDMQMPEMNGAQFLAKVKRQHPQSIRIMLTGNADQKTAVSAIHDGDVFRFLNKPCSSDQMEVALNEAIQRYHSEAVENSLLHDSVRQLNYLNDYDDKDPEIVKLNRLARDISALAAQIAATEQLDKELVDQCQLAGMMSCMGDLMFATRLKDDPAVQNGQLNSCQMTGYLLGSWGFPKKVAEAVTMHRQRIAKENQKVTLEKILHAAWFLLVEENELPQELKELETYDYLSGLVGSPAAIEWINLSEAFKDRELTNA